jgi:hypothetical protein
MRDAWSHLAPVTLTDRLFTYGVLGAAFILLLVVSICLVPDLLVLARAWFEPYRLPPLPRDPACFGDAYLAARRLKLATMNCPAPKGFSQAPAMASPMDVQSRGPAAATVENRGHVSAPVSAASACADAHGRPLPVAVEDDGRSSDHRATIVHFAARKGSVIH